jgi:hypothetical protein
MENEELYPELADYLYRYYDHLKTPDELLAGKSILYNRENMNPKMRELIIKKGWFSDEPHINAMISDGFEAFRNRVVQRIYAEHRNELDLNLCPKCKKIARTPWAEQCRFCFHSWRKKAQ